MALEEIIVELAIALRRRFERKQRNLRLIGPISDILFDQLVGAGCVSRVIAAWVGNVSEGLGHCYRRAVEQGIPHTFHWGKLSKLSPADVKLLYGDAVDQWTTARNQLLDAAARKTFSNVFLNGMGLS